MTIQKLVVPLKSIDSAINTDNDNTDADNTEVLTGWLACLNLLTAILSMAMTILKTLMMTILAGWPT